MLNDIWTTQHTYTLYNIEQWAEGYFGINPQGEMVVSPTAGQHTINLYELAQNLPTQGLSFPVLIRFPDILRHRVENLQQAFATAMQRESYHANYTVVYPIKVNQQSQVIKEIIKSEQVGLEAGSKSELMIVLALASPGSIIICNGYKDQEYIHVALIGQKMGLRPYIVIEKPSELALIIEESQRLQIVPHLGIRVRLATIGKGKWQNTGGERAKFGLTTHQVLEVVKSIKDAGLLEALQLMHFHIGSQVANIRDIQSALREAAHYYKAFRMLDVPIHIVDAGGGLSVDYEGTHSRRACSMNYSVQEYANNVVRELQEVCSLYQLPPPDIITESGRALTAHHAVLITNVIDVEPAPTCTLPHPVTTDDPTIIQDLWSSFNNLTPRSALEAYHDAVYALGEAHTLFTHGVLSLTQRAQAEQLYYAICQRVRELLQEDLRAHREILDELTEKLTDKYFCNFSLFQSVPDAWAIDQLFPIVPLHRLNEQPTRRVTIQDLTCDSDGQFEYYVEKGGVNTSLPAHALKPNEPYLLGIFLVGAYQEILGDMHNLFGDTCSVNVYMTAEGNYELVNPQEGDTVQSLLHYVNFNTSFLHNAYRRRLKATSLTVEQQRAYLQALEAGLIGHTYLET